MTDPSALTLPRARARRRKLPRPPKLDPWQKFTIATWVVAIGIIILGHELTPSAVALLAAGGARIHSVYMEALRRWREYQQSVFLCLGLWTTCVALAIAGL